MLVVLASCAVTASFANVGDAIRGINGSNENADCVLISSYFNSATEWKRYGPDIHPPNLPVQVYYDDWYDSSHRVWGSEEECAWSSPFTPLRDPADTEEFPMVRDRWCGINQHIEISVQAIIQDGTETFESIAGPPPELPVRFVRAMLKDWAIAWKMEVVDN